MARSRQIRWQHKQITHGLCPKCGGPSALKIIEQDGKVVDRKPMRLCWEHLSYSRDYHRNIEPIKLGRA